MPERLDDLTASFRRHLRAENRSDRTANIYALSVRQFGEWLESQGRPATVDQLSRSAIREWLAGRVEHGQAPGTVKLRHRGLHRFCGWLVDEGELTAHPMVGLRVPTVPVKPVPLLTDDELAALIKACAGTRYYDRRDETIIRFLLDTGVRVAELTGLTLDDLDLDHETAIVTGKGRRSRPVYFAARTARALDRYLRARRGHRWASLSALFLGERGPLTPDGVREIVRVRGEAAGLPGVHPHRFRHTFAHDHLLNGGQERDLMRLAGWSSEVMLGRYGAAQADLRARESTRRMRRGDRV